MEETHCHSKLELFPLDIYGTSRVMDFENAEPKEYTVSTLD